MGCAGGSEPVGITLEKFDYTRESMPLSAFTTAYGNLWTDTVNDPDYVILLVDGSGSMTKATLQTGYDQFKTDLDNDQYIILKTGETYSDEEWLSWVNDKLIDIFINNN